MVCSALLLAQGWLLIGNAQYRFDWVTFDFLPVPAWSASPWAPGALDTVEAAPAMLGLTGILGALLMLTEMAREPIWRRRLFGALLAGGLAVAGFGLLQRVLHSSLGLWDDADRDRTWFASFFYHGNAGAFVNLLVPALSLLAVRRPGVGTITALLLTLAASVAIASKAAMVITLLLMSAALVPALRTKRRLLLPALGCLLLFALLLPIVSERARARWSQLPLLLHRDNPRLLAWQASLRMLPDAGPWGIGPANFKFAFPHYTAGLDRVAVAGFWEHAHQDYLQTAIEWGWCGFVLWGLLIGGALRQGRGLIHRSALLGAAGLLLHALMDYPLQIPALQLYAAGWLGLLWSDRPAHNPTFRSVAETHL